MPARRHEVEHVHTSISTARALTEIDGDKSAGGGFLRAALPKPAARREPGMRLSALYCTVHFSLLWKLAEELKTSRHRR